MAELSGAYLSGLLQRVQAGEGDSLLAKAEPSAMRRFQLVRDHDVSGTSGTGTVIEGVKFSDDKVVAHWLGSTTGKPVSTEFWDSWQDMMEIHGHGVATRLVWIDDADGNQLSAAGG